MVKLKICGNATFSDIIELSKYNEIDYIGVVIEENSPRFVKPEFIKIIKNYVQKPIVSVKVRGSIKEILEAGKSADYIQIHRVLQDHELFELISYNIKKRLILYVPCNILYKNYLNKLIQLDFKILIDSPVKGKGIEISAIKELIGNKINDERIGIAGKISIENIESFLKLEPGWIDVASSVESYPGKKDMNKVRELIKAVKYGSISNF